MDQEQMAYFKALLKEQLEELTQRGSHMVNMLKDQENIYSDPVDSAAASWDQGFQLRITNRETRLINKIKDALERIEEGTFGICETCGEEISIGRLKARPVAMHCIRCKTLAEQMERVVG